MNKKNGNKILSEKEIDNIVIGQANEESAWEEPVNVRMTGEATVALPSDLAARAAFFAHLHRETSVADWLKRVIRERIDLEEAVFNELKRELASKRL